MGEVFTDIWTRATTAQPPPDLQIVALLGGAALLIVLTPAGYRTVRHLVTLIHEAGHALVAVLCGRQLRGIRLHSDTSGVTVSRGKSRGVGMIATVFAGYPAPAVFGLGAAWLLSQGYAVGLLWGSVLLCALMALQIRNLYGFWVLLVTGVGIGVASWMLEPVMLSGVAVFGVWTLLLCAPRSVIEMARQRRRAASRRGRVDSDADQLGRLTPLPAGFWTFVFLLLTLACLAVGAGLLLGRYAG